MSLDLVMVETAPQSLFLLMEMVGRGSPVALQEAERGWPVVPYTWATPVSHCRSRSRGVQTSETRQQKIKSHRNWETKWQTLYNLMALTWFPMTSVWSVSSECCVTETFSSTARDMLTQAVSFRPDRTENFQFKIFQRSIQYFGQLKTQKGHENPVFRPKFLCEF